MFSQLPCLGVKTNSSRSHSVFASAGANVSYNAAALCEARLSITKVMIFALGYSLSQIYCTNNAQSFFVRLWVTFIYLLPANGSLTIKTLQTPLREYS